MKEAIFLCYPWDLEDEGLDVALGRLAGEIGVNAVSVVVVSPRVSELRPRMTDAARILTMDAGAHFQPSARVYDDCRIRPHTVASLKSRNQFDKIAKAAASHSLGVRAVVVACRNENLISRYPMAACVNLVGYSSPSRLCPANPEVRAYLAALTADLSENYAIDAIEFSDAHFGEPFTTSMNIDQGVTLDAISDVLLSWCFCAACRQRAADAGIDMESVRAEAFQYIEAAFQLEKNRSLGSFQEFLDQASACAAYDRMRCEAVTSLMKTIRQRSDCPLHFHAPNNVYSSGAVIESLREFCNGLVIPPSENAGETTTPQSRYDERTAQWSDRASITIGMHCHPPHTPDGPTLVSAVRFICQQGYESIIFSNYGMAPEPCLDWVRQAIRYARRESNVVR